MEAKRNLKLKDVIGIIDDLKVQQHNEKHIESFLLGYLMCRMGNEEDLSSIIFLFNYVNDLISEKTLEKQHQWQLFQEIIDLQNHQKLPEKAHDILSNIMSRSFPVEDQKQMIETSKIRFQQHQGQPQNKEINTQMSEIALLQILKDIQNEEIVKEQMVRMSQINEEEKQSQQLIEELMRQEESLLRKENNQLTSEIFMDQNCAICLDTNYQVGDDVYTVLVLSECSHAFHRDCIRDFIKSEIQSMNFPIICPALNCQERIIPSDLKQCLESNQVDEYEQRSFNQFIDNNLADYSWCPSAGCQYVFSKEENQTMFMCPSCTQNYCLECRTQYHQGQTCQEYRISNNFGEQDELFMSLIKVMKYKQCPKCQHWVEKNEGCDHMTCRCQKEFCYICGGDYPNCNCYKRR